ncbi:hypothetical protein Halha_1382 [Halobacteroides halobius DSM 5150]|uniref:Divergent polysaccharide deacetylase n=1 Tax=Halobacteroides halobius (strain ATCC 35273 / DSM 5150 / MD-1) TaxID=748449 RepID=L0K7U4_HALHC|nr:divergent polysaccharide deacetylase family protein [Halobacteroides halobius]AGB41327.1 hypothetical protein Halha_1382 [Halobacteroides halobius DSM 5150]
MIKFKVEKRIHFIVVISVFLFSSIFTFFIKGNNLLANERLAITPGQKGIKTIVRAKIRNVILYSSVSQAINKVVDHESYQVRKRIESLAIDLSHNAKIALKDVGYKNGKIYYNFSSKIYKLKLMEQFALIDSLLQIGGRINGAKTGYFLINGRKAKLSSYINFKSPFRVRRGPAKVAIIIDDFGNRAAGTDEILKLEQKITCAILPFKETSTEEAREIKENGFDVIVHLPMESEKGKLSWLGSKPILTSLSTKEIKSRVQEAIIDIPTAIGFNNHTGSKATANKRVMEAILKVAKSNNLIAIDSRTTSKSVVGQLANKLEVPYLERDVFLDNKKDYGDIRKNLLLLVAHAIKEGQAIGIGHVGPHGGRITFSVLSKILPSLDKIGIKFVGISDLI